MNIKHSDYITHINNEEDKIYLKSKLFPVNMRLFNSSSGYKQIVESQCRYLKFLCITEKEGYKKPHSMSSANAGLTFNIIAITRNRNKLDEYCEIMINPRVVAVGKEKTECLSNCGSITLNNPIKVSRYNYIEVEYYNESGTKFVKEFGRKDEGFTIQHEIDHNMGILITDK